jgi:hypothetical protein
MPTTVSYSTSPCRQISAPLKVTFDGSTSTDPYGEDTLSYAWVGDHIVRLRVTDTSGVTDEASATVRAEHPTRRRHRHADRPAQLKGWL